MNDLLLVRKNLFRKKLRAGLMIASILIAFAIFGVLAAFERAFNAGEDVAAADRLVVVNKINFTQPLPMAYFNRVRGVDGVRQATHLNWFGGYFQDPKNFLLVFAVEPETYTELYADDFDFPAEARKAFIGERTAALVGEAMAAKWGWKVGDHVPISSNIFSQKDGSRTWDFTIAGIFKSRGAQANTNFMVFQYEYFNETRSFLKDMIGWMALQTTSPLVNDKVAKAIDQMFANSLGFTGGRLLRLVLSESVLLALLGGLPGLALAFLVTLLVRDQLANFVPGIALTPRIVLLGLVLMLGLGFATGLVPALNAFRLKIAVALGRG